MFTFGPGPAPCPRLFTFGPGPAPLAPLAIAKGYPCGEMCGLEVEWIGKENEVDWIGVEEKKGDW